MGCNGKAESSGGGIDQTEWLLARMAEMRMIYHIHRRSAILASSLIFILAMAVFPDLALADGSTQSEDLQPLSVAGLFESKGKTMKEVATELVTLSEDKDIWGLDFSPDGKLLATTSPQTLAVHVWDWQNRRIMRTFERPRGSNLGVAEPIRFSPDGRLLASCPSQSGPNNSVTRIWNAETGNVVHDIEEPNSGGCQAIAFSPDGRYLLRIVNRRAEAPEDGLIIYKTTTWQPVWGLRKELFYWRHLAISPDGKWVAVAGSTAAQPQILIVDMAQRAIVRTMQVAAERIDWSPDGAHIVVGGGKDSIMIFDARSGELVASEKGEDGHVLVRYTPDGKYLIDSIYTKVKIWDGQHLELYQEIPASPGSLAVSRDGHFVAMGGDKKVIVWELK